MIDAALSSVREKLEKSMLFPPLATLEPTPEFVQLKKYTTDAAGYQYLMDLGQFQFPWNKERTVFTTCQAAMYNGGGLGCHLITLSNPYLTFPTAITAAHKKEIISACKPMEKYLTSYGNLSNMTYALPPLPAEQLALVRESLYEHIATHIPATYLFYIFSDRMTSELEGNRLFSTTPLVKYLIEKKGWMGSGSHKGGNPMHQGQTLVQLWTLTHPNMTSFVIKDSEFVTPYPENALTEAAYLDKYGQPLTTKKALHLFDFLKEKKKNEEVPFNFGNLY